MNMQYSMIDMLPKASASLKEVRKSHLESRYSSSQFRSVFERSLDNRKTAAGNEKAQENSKPEVKAYRDIIRSQRQEAAVKRMDGKYGQHREPMKADLPEPKDEKEIKAEAAVEGLAQVLAVTPGELMKLFKLLDIKPEDLLDENAVTQVADKLALLTGLTPEQKSTLQTLIDAVGQQLGHAESEGTDAAAPVFTLQQATNTAEKGQDDPGRLASVQKPVVEIVHTSTQSTDLTGVMNRLKVKLQEISEQLRSNPQAIMDELSGEIKAYLDTHGVKAGTSETAWKAEETSLKTGVDPETSDTAAVQAVEANGEKPSSLREEAESRHGKDTQATAEGANEPKSVPVKASPQPVGNSDNNAVSVGAAAVGQELKPSVMESIKPAREPAPVPRNEILNQVVEKAKVVLSAEKSEMVMDLKPDSLGKLALKVVTERGIVAAQFVAENQQVKEVLEANMQILKDALEKQGLAVQSFSVSVGQDQANGFMRRENRTFPETRNTSARPETPGTVRVAENMTSSQRHGNPYNWSSNTINLTA